MTTEKLMYTTNPLRVIERGSESQLAWLIDNAVMQLGAIESSIAEGVQGDAFKALRRKHDEIVIGRLFYMERLNGTPEGYKIRYNRTADKLHVSVSTAQTHNSYDVMLGRKVGPEFVKILNDSGIFSEKTPIRRALRAAQQLRREQFQGKP